MDSERAGPLRGEAYGDGVREFDVIGGADHLEAVFAGAGVEVAAASVEAEAVFAVKRESGVIGGAEVEPDGVGGEPLGKSEDGAQSQFTEPTALEPRLDGDAGEVEVF